VPAYIIPRSHHILPLETRSWAPRATPAGGADRRAMPALLKALESLVLREPTGRKRDGALECQRQPSLISITVGTISEAPENLIKKRVAFARVFNDP
jgi:hypothetical protein